MVSRPDRRRRKRKETLFSVPECDRQTERFEPLQMSDMPSGPWENLSADFCGLVSTGEYPIVVIDEYSRFPVVETIKSTSANATILVLYKLIATFGLPKVIKTITGVRLTLMRSMSSRRILASKIDASLQDG
jgi:hypothetical protein